MCWEVLNVSWIDEYLNTVARQIRVKRIREPLMQELRDHMELQRQDYLREGLCESEAQKRTLADMGDALLVGGELDKVHRPRTHWKGVFLALFFLALGILLQHLLSNGQMLPFGMNSVFACIAAGLILLIGTTDYTIWTKFTFPALSIWLFFYVWRYHLMVCRESICPLCRLALPWPVRGIIVRISPECICVAMPMLLAFMICALRGRKKGAFLLCSSLPAMIVFLAGVYDRTSYSYNGMMLMALTGFAILLFAVHRGFFRISHKKATALVVAMSIIPIGDFLRKIDRDFSDASSDFFAEISQVLSASRLFGTGAEIPELSEAMALYPNVGENLLPLMIHRFGWIPFLIFTAAIASLLIWCLVRFLKMENRMGSLLGTSASVILIAQCALYYFFSFTPCVHYLGLPLVSYGNAMLAVDAILVGVILSTLRCQDLPEPRSCRQFRATCT